MAQLLKGGRVLVHDDKNNVSAIKADILVRGDKIERVEAQIQIDGPHEVLDCSNKLIAPGFVDTHHHAWQTQLKGLHANHTLLEYLPQGNQSASFFEPDDIFYGQLTGCLEALNGGTTTFLDYSHCAYSPKHVYSAIQATEASGIRSVYGFCPNPRSKLNDQGRFDPLPMLEPWIMETFNKLAEDGPWSRTELGFAFDGLFLPKEMLKPVLDDVYSRVKVLTTHDNSSAMFNNKPSGFKVLSDAGLLDPANKAHWVMAHPTKLQDNPMPDLEKHNFFASVTPVSELSMGMGQPVPIALNLEHKTIQPLISIGADCHTISEGFLAGQLRAQLLAVRQCQHAKEDAQNKWYASMNPKHGTFAGVQDAFNMATINGARALGKENSIGSIKPGYKADLVIWETTSPSMLAAAEDHPVAAIVIHSQPGDVSGVMVDGKLRKREGKLLPSQVAAPAGLLAEYTPPVLGDLPWDVLAKALLKSRERIMPLVKKIDLAGAAMDLIAPFGLNKAGVLDPVTSG